MANPLTAHDIYEMCEKETNNIDCAKRGTDTSRLKSNE